MVGSKGKVGTSLVYMEIIAKASKLVVLRSTATRSSRAKVAYWAALRVDARSEQSELADS